MINIRAAVLKVLNNRLAHAGREGVNRCVSTLASRDMQLCLGPIDILKLNCGDLPGTQAVVSQQQQDRIVALAQSIATVDRIDDALHVFLAESAGNRRLAVGPPPGHGAVEIGGDKSLAVQVPEKHAQHAATAVHTAWRPGLGSLKNERINQRRCDRR